MQSCWTGILAALVILVGLAEAVPNNQILEGPKDATVLVGSEARFNCTVSPGWQLLMWLLNGVVVLSLTPNDVIITNERFTTESYPVGGSGGDLISELIIHSVQLGDAGQVRCSLQDNSQNSTALLSVQAVGTLFIPETEYLLRDQPHNVTCHASDWTPLPDLSWELEIQATNWSYSSVLEPGDPHSISSVLTLVPQDSGAVTCVAHMKGLSEPRSVTANLTVVSSLSSESGQALPTWAIVLLAVSLTLLLILIIALVVIFCCYYPPRREKKAWSYQSEPRKPADVKPNATSEVKTKGGEENYGYSPDELQTRIKRVGGPTQGPHRQGSREEIVASLPVKSSQPRVMEDHGSVQPQQVPGHRQTSLAHVSFAVASPRTVRNATVV